MRAGQRSWGASTTTRSLPEALALGAGVPQASLDPLGNQAALQLGHATQDGEDHLAGRHTGIGLL